MTVTASELRPSQGIGWRTPLVIIICGCAIALLSFGPRSSVGFFIQPMGRELSFGRDVFGLALALQNLLWGLGQPIAGAIADRFGVLRVMCVGALLYAGGLLMMRYATTPLSLDIGAGVLIGFGLSGCSFNLVLSAFSKLLPPEKRGIALGAGTAAGSFGQFLFAPFGVALIDNFGWQSALMVFAGLMLLIIPLSFALMTPPATAANGSVADQQSFRTALAEAFGHRSYVLLVLGFFTCGFQLAFITVHLPAYLSDRGVSARILATCGQPPVDLRELVPHLAPVAACAFGAAGELVAKARLPPEPFDLAGQRDRVPGGEHQAELPRSHELVIERELRDDRDCA